MTTTLFGVCCIAGAVAGFIGLCVGAIVGIVMFGEKPPVGALKIRYDETEKDPYIFLELWKEAGDITEERTVNLVVSVAEHSAPK